MFNFMTNAGGRSGPAKPRTGVISRAVVATLVAATATVLAVAGPAQANTQGREATAALAGTQDCPVHYACLWVDWNWSGSRWQGQFNNPTLPSFINNKASSSFNNGTSCTAHFTTNAGYAGNVLSEGIGSIRQNLALDRQPNGVSWNDTIESLYWCSKG